MKDGVPQTLEEALKLIEKQSLELQEKNSELQKQQEEIQRNQKTIADALIEIAHLNEQLAIKRAREFAARSEKSSRINRDQNLLPFDLENPDCENSVAEEKEELTEESEVTAAAEE